MGRIYGYCRVSSKKQNIERQVRNILAVYPTAIIVKEVFAVYGVRRSPFRFRTAAFR